MQDGLFLTRKSWLPDLIPGGLFLARGTNFGSHNQSGETDFGSQNWSGGPLLGGTDFGVTVNPRVGYARPYMIFVARLD